MTLNTETPPPREPLKNSEALQVRGEIISAVNNTYSLMEAVAQDLARQPQRTADQERQVTGFKITKEGRKILVGADSPLTDELATDRFINEVEDPETGEVLEITEGLRANPFEEFLKKEIYDLQLRLAVSNDPEDKNLLSQLMEKRQRDLGVFERNTSPYKPANEQERKARIKQEAYWISIDEKRDTADEKGNWYNAETEVDEMKFIDIPPFRVTDAYTQGYRLRAMPRRVGLRMSDMPQEDTSGEGRVADTTGGRQRKMPARSGIEMEEMPEEEAAVPSEADQRVRDSRKVIKDAYTLESDNADRIVNAYGLETVGDKVDKRGRRFESNGEPLPRDKGSAFSDLGNYNISEDERVVDAYGLRTEKRSSPRRSGFERNVTSRSDRTNPFSEISNLNLPQDVRVRNAFGLRTERRPTERTNRTDRESRARRLRGLPPALLIPLILGIAVALLRDQQGGRVIPEQPARSTPDTSGPEDYLKYKVIWPEGKANLTGHFYNSQPDASGSYGSLYGHEIYELAKVLDPTLKPQQGESADFDRIKTVVDQFADKNPDKFEEILKTYTKGVVDNNPAGTIQGEDAIVSAQFNSIPMKQVYDQVMAKGGT